MKLNFKELHVYNGVSRTKESIEDVRELFADAIYSAGNGVAALELCRKIYNSDGEEEYTDREVELIKQYASLGTPRFIEAVMTMIDNAKKQENKRIQESGAAAGD